MGKTSNYTGVSKNQKSSTNDKSWLMSYTTKTGMKAQKGFETERAAAIAYDIKRLQMGKNPVNILIRKTA